MIRGAQGSCDEGLIGCVEMDEGHAHASPAAVDRGEGLWLLGDEGLLLLWSKLDHPATFS